MLTQKSSRPTRQRLLDAAEQLMRTSGLVSATTKAIAREAECSEAALYKHFASKEELFVRVLIERTPSAGPLITELTTDAAATERTVEERLALIARHATDFYAHGMPMTASLFADPGLLARHREGILKLGGGPHKVLDALTACLSQEQALGRVAPHADPRAAATLLLGACFQRAFLLHFSGPGLVQPLDEFVTSVARTTWTAIR
jgi:AcrR family transcriptional regulator